MNIYVGNVSYNTTNDDLREAFESYGEVTSAVVVNDKETGRSKGFGFVEMTTKEDGLAAITAMNGKELNGRTLRVNEAQPRPERKTGGFRSDKKPSYNGNRDRNY